MNKITFPLAQGMQGAAVADLQDALQLCLDRSAILANDPAARQQLSVALKPERDGQTYGDVTGKLVKIFQGERHLQQSGEVDEPTANALNALLQEWGLLDTQKTYQVDGKVASRISAGVGGLRVVIVDKGVGSNGDGQLAEATTDDRGAYQASFSDSDVQRRGKAQPDLQARVLAGDGFLGASDVHYNASQHETLNVLLDDKAASSLSSEVDVLNSAIASQYNGNLRDLKETDDQQDITYLANKTGWDARAVALAALADQFSARTAEPTSGIPAIPQEFFYALFRAGLPANEDALYQADSNTLGAVWKQAVAQGVIPQASEDQISSLVATFQALSAQKLLTSPALIGASSFKEMLTTSGLNEAQQKKFSQLYAANRTDMPAFWKAVGDAFRKDIADRLQVDGKLGFLTINNAPLMQKIHATAGRNGLSDPLQLAQMGYHRAEAWSQLLTPDVPIPNEIPGDTADAKRANYASYLAAQIRVSYPTAAVAQMVKSKELPLTGAPIGVSDKVYTFLTEQQGKFEIGVQPVQQYVADNNLQLDGDVIQQVKRLQRVYQITPSDQAMIGLMKRGIDAAYRVVRYDRDTFVQSFAADLGGADQAALTYDRSVQVHNAVLNVALSYLYARTAPAIGVHSPGGVLDPAPANVGDVIAYATLESLFDSMDFCACEHCRSILSPAAYLVDLLQFLGSDDDVWRDFVTNWKSPEGGHEGAPYPFPNQAAFTQAGSPTNSEISPFEVLMSRRPDIQHLPLTCENTNTALPYIDVVNETLEYYIANGLTLERNTLAEYLGHDTNDAASEDLLASPQFVVDSAYSTLGSESFPTPLPFHQPLENLRRYFNKFDVPLPLAMERLRKDDRLDVDRTTNPPPLLTDYGWRDILMEELGLSRAEYDILTTSDVNENDELKKIFGFAATETSPIDKLSNAKQFARRVGVTYEDLVSILKTQFINPNSDLIPKVERLGVSFATLKALKDGHTSDGTPFTDADFIALLPTDLAAPDPAEYGGDIKAWVKNDDNYARIMGLITLAVSISKWAASKVYAVGDCVLPTVPQAEATLYYECTTPGTSGASEPTWPTTPGNKTDPPDGTVVWTCRELSSCYNFDKLSFRYSDPAKFTQNISAVEYIRLLRFIRLWKKLGWTIEQTDAAICALYRADLAPLDASDINDVAKLDTGFLTLLPRLGIIMRVMNALNLKVKRDLLPLLACWSEIGTHDGVVWISDTEGGLHQQIVPSLYRQMFLNPAIVTQDAVFKDNGYGEFLTDSSQTLFATNSTKKAKLAGRITVSDVLSTSINGLVVPYTVVAGDTSIPRLATQVVSKINATTTADPITGKPLNDVIVASSTSGIITITMKDPKPDSSITLACSVSDGARETYAPLDHESALCAALNLTGSEFTLITDALNFDAATPLSLANISAIFRRGWLARKLRLSVRELLLLIELTALDPFAAPDIANPAILQLISLVQALKDRSLKSAVALYLIWNQDLSGKSTPDSTQIAELARTLRGDFASIDDQFAAIEDPNGDVARSRMALVYGQETSDAFFALLDDTVVVDVAYTHTAPALEPPITAADPAIAYDDFRHRLSHTGLVTTAIQAALKSVAGVSADFQKAVDALYHRSEEIKGLFFTRYPELKAPYDRAVTGPSPNRHSAFLAAFDPELARRRKRQQSLQRLSAAAGVDLAFTQTILDPTSTPYPLHAGGDQNKPALDDMIAVQTPGLAVQFFFRDTATGNIDKSVAAAANLNYASGGSNPLPNPGNAISGIWSGQIEAPEAGFYNFVIEADNEATATLTLDGQVLSRNSGLTQNGNVWRNTDPIDLNADTLYEIELKVEKVKDALSVEWETPKRGREVIPSRYLYPPAILDPFSNAYVRFLKAASLAAAGLGLTANELAFFATHSDYQIGGDGWLDALSVSGDPAPATAAALLKPFEAMLDFARIKADISPSDESLLTVLKDPTAATEKRDSLLFTIMRWDQPALNDVLTQFGANIAGLGHFDLFRRVYDAFALIQKMGISAKALIEATANEPKADTVRDLQAALRARYDPASWRDVVRPINDDMRGLQRDALVAYILHQMRSHPEREHIDTPDKLFEYFLMDVEMDACMQTSRIRHALSSVQLFIERCLMNLEPRVSPAAINATQWQWMKRYRVWEANRKVFLWPENWLEPELRDDQSPFFKETMSELLQGDITEDRAAVALLNYLSKLEEVAKLEPCGMYYVEQNESRGEVVHLVARTTGAHRKYYYRRYEYGYWTPWEQIKLDVEDNPVIPVVWNDRLFLFWLRILKQGPDTAQKPPPRRDLTQLTTDDLPGDPRITLQAVLCWSEYYNGKWQVTKTSDVNKPVSLFSTPGFDRSTLGLRSDESQSGQLMVMVTVYGYVGPGAFLLFNTHSLPLPLTPEHVPQPFGKTRTFETAGPTFTVVYDELPDVLEQPLLRDVLTEQIPTATVQPNHCVSDIWDAPFFFEDRRNMFYVRTAERLVPTGNIRSFGVSVNPGVMKAAPIAPLVVQPGPSIQPKFWGDGGPIGPGSGVIDPAPMQRFVTEDAYIRQGIGSTGAVMYGGKQIGPSGVISDGQAK